VGFPGHFIAHHLAPVLAKQIEREQRLSFSLAEHAAQQDAHIGPLKPAGHGGFLPEFSMPAMAPASCQRSLH
jgi:hypothetical protein